eukprot:754578-Hanusia_phi.AAC.6
MRDGRGRSLSSPVLLYLSLLCCVSQAIAARVCSVFPSPMSSQRMPCSWYLSRNPSQFTPSCWYLLRVAPSGTQTGYSSILEGSSSCSRNNRSLLLPSRSSALTPSGSGTPSSSGRTRRRVAKLRVEISRTGGELSLMRPRMGATRKTEKGRRATPDRRTILWTASHAPSRASLLSISSIMGRTFLTTSSMLLPIAVATISATILAPACRTAALSLLRERSTGGNALLRISSCKRGAACERRMEQSRRARTSCLASTSSAGRSRTARETSRKPAANIRAGERGGRKGTGNAEEEILS